MTGPNKHIRTFTGKEINLLTMRAEDIDIDDIAHSLACINRFNGHAKYPISVAQHSVFVSRLCDPSHRLQGLLHDAAEAYVGDMTKWLKHTREMASFRLLEDIIQELIFTKFNCSPTLNLSIEMADRIMVRFEGENGFNGSFKIDHPDYPPLTGDEIYSIGHWYPWDWRLAEMEFLETFHECYKKI